MEQEADRVTKDRLRQAGSLLRELEEERERYTRELRHHKRLEECYGVGCLFGRSSVEMARDRLVRIEQICEDERADIQLWIDGVQDSVARRALRLRYIDGRSWSECARRLGYADESGPRKLAAKYIPEK